MSRRILYVQYTNPAAYPPIEHSALLLADAGWDVRLLGVANTPVALPDHERIHVELVPSPQPGWRQKAHYVRFGAWAMREARRWRPAWIYASDALACPIALGMTTLGATPLLYHEHDSPDAAAHQSSPFMRAVLASRGAVARRARLCVLPNERRAEAFADLHPGTRPATVWNCPTVREVHGVVPSMPADGLRVLYHGSIVPARLPLTVLDALAMLPSTATLVVAGYETAGHPGYVEALRQRARALGILDRVEFAGTVPTRRELLRHCATCHVGLALMPQASSDLNEQAMVGASNKPFDYMACGLALIVANLPDWRATFADGGYGLACDPASPESLASAFRQLLDDTVRRRAMGERGRRKILEDWNYERSFAPVLAKLSERPAAATAPARADVAPPEVLSR